MPAAEYQQLRDGGDLFGASREERLPYIRENAVSDLTFIGRSSGRGQAELSPGAYWLDLRRVDTDAEGSFTFDYTYQVYSADTDE